MDEEIRIRKRFSELLRRAESGGYTVFTDFLGIEEQDLLNQCCDENAYFAYGGYAGAERVVAAFDADMPAPADYPIACICVQPKKDKFAEALTHRDYLGALMGLGVKRSVLGDILIDGKNAYVFCLQNISAYICENLCSVRHTAVRCALVQSVPSAALPKQETIELVVPSLRLDVLVAAVYRLSRRAAEQLFIQQKVFENGRQITDRSHIVKPGAKITVRGFGRFVFLQALRQTKKARLVVAIGVH